MTGGFTKKGLYMAEDLLDAEYIACRKAQQYANTLTDMDLAAFFGSVAERHKMRLKLLLSILAKE